MAIDLKNYEPALMAGATVSNAGETVTGTLSVSGASTLTGAVTASSTLGVTGALTASSTLGVTGVSTLTGGVNSVGVLTANSGNTVPATAGAVAAGIPIQMFSNGPAIYVTSDAPTHTAVKGSICINTGGSSSSTRLYVNSTGSTTWVAITTAS